MAYESDAERFRELLAYDPDSGVLIWRVRPHPRSVRRAGDRAGGMESDGYRSIRLFGRTWKEHRIAWLLMTGRWPERFLDHRNRDKADNRWSNLREADDSQNGQNVGLRGGVSGVRGVYPAKGGAWQAFITVRKRQIYLGRFHSLEAGAAARLAAEAAHFTHHIGS